MTPRVISGIVLEIYTNADSPLKIADVHERLLSIGLKPEYEKVRRCVVNLCSKKVLETFHTDYKRGSSYQLRKKTTDKDKQKDNFLLNDNRSALEKTWFPFPVFSGNARIVSFSGNE